MSYHGSCHCGNVSFEVAGTVDTAVECNCSHCSRKAYLFWFVPRTALSMKEPEVPLVTYTFNSKQIKHQSCPNCGCGIFGISDQGGYEMIAINIRSLDDIDLASVKREQVDGKSR